MSTAGADLAVLYNFCSAANCADGAQPNALIQGTDGNLYGTTQAGGIVSSSCLGAGCGTVFRYALATGSFTSLHAFNPAQDGALPHGLIQASDGNFYGTDCGSIDGAGCAAGLAPGYVFRVTPGGQYSVIMTFPDLPLTGLVESAGGMLFGVVLGSCGSELFQVNLDGSGSRNRAYASQYGERIRQFLTRMVNLWLTSGGTGRIFNGAVYRLSPKGILFDTVLFNDADGRAPWASLIQLKSGQIAGTTLGGGTLNQGPPDFTAGGVVFTIDAGLPAPGIR
jgi:uncharacterized repeat protein (TIGR03803 family)